MVVNAMQHLIGTLRHPMLVAVAAAAVSIATSLRAENPACEAGAYTFTTNDYFFGASSSEGAVGDVVALDLSVTVDNAQDSLAGFTVVGCYDSEDLELLPTPAYSSLFDELTFLVNWFPLDGVRGLVRPNGGPGFVLSANFRPEGVDQYFREGSTLELATLFFRVKGTPGKTALVQFCDFEFAVAIPGGACGANDLYYIFPNSDTFTALSERHVAGEVRILAGETTHPNPPELPPDAKVYPAAPTPNTAAIHFELEGPAVTHPGATDVPIELFVTSSFEFSGFMASLMFPARYLELTHVDEHIRPGILSIDNDSGTLGVLMSGSRRRIGAEGERVRLATLHFAVKEEAAETSTLNVEIAPAGNYFNWLAIQHREGIGADPLPITTEITPIFVSQSLLRVQTMSTMIGDVNFDRGLDLSDAVALLNYLFQGGAVACLTAADFNADARTDISDAVGILRALFLEVRSPAENRAYCDG